MDESSRFHSLTFFVRSKLRQKNGSVQAVSEREVPGRRGYWVVADDGAGESAGANDQSVEHRRQMHQERPAQSGIPGEGFRGEGYCFVIVVVLLL